MRFWSLWLAFALALPWFTWLNWQRQFVAVAAGGHGGPGPWRVLRGDPAAIGSDPAGRRLEVPGGGTTLELALHGLRPAPMVHVAGSLHARALQPGARRWEDGRLHILGRDRDGRLAPGHLAVGSVRYARNFEIPGVVAPMPAAGLEPVLVAGNLGTGGSMVIEALVLTPVARRSAFFWNSGLLAAGWCALAAGAFRRAGGPAGWWRVLAAALVWLGLAAFLVFPGPWLPWRPLGLPFELGPGAAGAAQVVEPLAVAGDPALEVPAQPDHGDRVAVHWLFEIKRFVRPVLHAGCYAAATLVLALLAGPRGALAGALALSAGSEALQAAYGFGFGFDDVLDLLVNGAGIWLGLRLHGRLLRRLG
jgi:hypothetical protein